MKTQIATSALVLTFGLSTAAMAEIRIGSTLSQSGPASFLGAPEAKTLEMLVEEVNAAGSVLGEPLAEETYGADDVPLYQSHGVASYSYIELAGDAANGVRLPATALLVTDKLSEDDPQYEVVSRYKTAYEERTGVPVSTFGGYAHDAFHMLEIKDGDWAFVE